MLDRLRIGKSGDVLKTAGTAVRRRNAPRKWRVFRPISGG